MVVEEFFPPHASGFEIRLFRTPVRSFGDEEIGLANVDEVATFVTSKRKNEHLTGRWLLGESLVRMGYDVSSLEVLRTSMRAPILNYLPGVWLNSPLPSVSVCHSNGFAYVALCDSNWSVGFDAELAQRGIASNAYDMMSKGEELLWLHENPSQAIHLWTAKEAVQKAMQMGMHLNPRIIQIPIGIDISEISIEKSIIQLQSWTFQDVQMSLAWKRGSEILRTPEDALLDATQAAMSDGEWSVGCKTTRSNV